MKIILLADLKNIGKQGDVKDVSEGYARNFLLPKKLAQIATPAAEKNLAEIKKQQKLREEEETKKLKELAAKLQGKEITIKAKEKKGKLFGSITAKNIAAELKKENFPINENLIILTKPIKEVGEYAVKIELGYDIAAGIKAIVMSEK